jgi:hypothetical protein
MANTVYEYPGAGANRGYIGFTRFWKKGEFWIQITLVSENMRNENVHTYASIPYKEFVKASKAVNKDLKQITKDSPVKS